MNEVGYLGLPKIKITRRQSQVTSQFTELFSIYSDFVNKSAQGLKKLEQFTNDERFQKYIGKMISHGGATIFEFERLTMWYFWNFNEYGEDKAEQKINNFLNFDKYIQTRVLWITGLTLDYKIELNDGYAIVPISQISDCEDKEIFLNSMFNRHNLIQYPQAAVLKNFEADIIFDHTTQMNENSEWVQISRKLYDISILINCIEECHSTANYSTSYSLEAPFGPFNSNGGGGSIHDVISFHTSKFNPSNTELLNALIRKFSSFSENKKHKYYRILNRLSQAKRRISIEDKILDLAIALEMVLLDNSNKDQLSLSFRLRGSWLLDSEPTQRKVSYKILKELYTYRSEIAHTGLLCKNNATEIENVRSNLPKYISITDKIVQKSILDDLPDWDNLILGIE